MNTLAKELRKRRNERGYTQKDVANLIGVSLRMYLYYEGKVWPPHDQLLKLNLLFQYDFSIHIYGRWSAGTANRTAKRRNVNNAGKH